MPSSPLYEDGKHAHYIIVPPTTEIEQPPMGSDSGLPLAINTTRLTLHREPLVAGRQERGRGCNRRHNVPAARRDDLPNANDTGRDTSAFTALIGSGGWRSGRTATSMATTAAATTGGRSVVVM